RLVTSGIWRNVELIAFDPARLTDVFITQEDLKPEMARLNAQVELEASGEMEALLTIAVNSSEVIRKRVSCKQGRQTFNIPFRIANPERWWPNGLGDQILYNVEVQLEHDDRILDRKYHRIGLRTIEVVQKDDPDGMGKGFYFEVNGRPVFAKGANYIPNDLFLPRVSHKTYESILGSAQEANMNMIRVWGGGIYEDDYFYQQCDEKGLLVWQDFMFACSMYPGDELFLDNVEQEAIDNVKRLRNHPCIALWCGNNEIETAWGEYEENAGWGWKQRYNEQQRREIWKDYEKVFHELLPEVVEKYTDKDFYWKSSPTAGDGLLANHQSRSGDMHYWGVWHAKHPFTDFDTYVGRFMSEYGFQSFPLFSSVRKYTVEEDWDIESEVMTSHQRSGIGNLRIKEYMAQDYQLPDNFRDLLYVGQVLQADGIRYAIEAHRKNMPYCMGSLYWQINDCWPVASWSSIDYYGKWKALQFIAKEAFKNEILSIWRKDEMINIYAISDLSEARDEKFILSLMDFSGNILWGVEKNVRVGNNSSRIIYSIKESELLENQPINQVVLVAKLTDLNGAQIDRAFFLFKPAKNLQLQVPNIDYTWNGKDLSIFSDTYVKSIYLEIPQGNGRFSDNFFDLLPREKTVVSWKGDLSKEQKKDLVLLHLQQTMKN
ncbi:MAG: glycoside hydrolase family 2 protein, partial [Saprospiraceae bacterium]|nr:glycoside hydrolase family 2 protein [Saprospiraceae bacterium]